MAGVWRPEDKLQDSVPSTMWVPGLASRAITRSLSHPACPLIIFLKGKGYKVYICILNFPFQFSNFG